MSNTINFDAFRKIQNTAMQAASNRSEAIANRVSSILETLATLRPVYEKNPFVVRSIDFQVQRINALMDDMNNPDEYMDKIDTACGEIEKLQKQLLPDGCLDAIFKNDSFESCAMSIEEFYADAYTTLELIDHEIEGLNNASSQLSPEDITWRYEFFDGIKRNIYESSFFIASAPVMNGEITITTDKLGELTRGKANINTPLFLDSNATPDESYLNLYENTCIMVKCISVSLQTRYREIRAQIEAAQTNINEPSYTEYENPIVERAKEGLAVEDIDLVTPSNEAVPDFPADKTDIIEEPKKKTRKSKKTKV